jgi:hypothetical protein
MMNNPIWNSGGFEIICMQHDLDKALNMKLVLWIFEQMLRLKINFHKSELFFW